MLKAASRARPFNGHVAASIAGQIGRGLDVAFTFRTALQICPVLALVVRTKGSGLAATSPTRRRAGTGSSDAITSLRLATENDAAAKSGVRCGPAIKGCGRPTPISGRPATLS